MNKYIFHIVFLGVMTVGLMSCEKDFLDVNTDPNNPTESSVDLILPTAEGYTAYIMGNPYQILGGLWSQYWTQGPTGSQYKNFDQYTITSSDFDRQWLQLYSGPLNDSKYLIDEGTRLNRKNYAAIGKILQAYIYQYLTDLHGDIPFSEALDPNNPSPKYDTQEQVYNGLVKLIEDGVALIDEASDDHPGEDDFLFGGDMTLWKKFANTLKLRVYLRQAYVRPDVAQAGINALYTSGAQFLEAGEDAEMAFTDEIFNQNPLFATYQALTEDNLVASETTLNYFTLTHDPRVDVFYQQATLPPNAGHHAGIEQGNGTNLINQNANSYSKPGPEIGGPNGGEAAPVVFMSAAESYFLQAEAAARGWGTGNAQLLYNQAILSSFLRWGFTIAQANAFISQSSVAFPNAGSKEEKIKAIITQKWSSMSGTQNLEAWTEWRRTGYPNFFEISVSSNIGNKFPTRILYPDSEVTRNANTPAQKTVSDKVWWDVNTTGQN
ncbi:SusD/RagB family nutrient-binding outer membrane lipoprotein [Chitinophagaceae bacterium LB-8]|uniref:SusD/RagB family nutrient-binding outer membrane lipoprotein n=1 Tax=Paraflavisolibacter caeni TaxID=2982496 RepID=A0A9X2XZN8_9BACT|nr:SusD/RagB family nutrient-binding outer membrane lipoprotein [Paraflavisolibacter caeni]MCU7552386.1 SusD/RagB family nutrient-binding outer membrane lipoprotein [Paraflavisolibacter caeni]